jgi:hypothetical protein
VPDTNGDEVDGLDEGALPVRPADQRAALIDDEINTLFSARKAGVRLLLISDSCHSGTVTRAAAADPGRRRRAAPAFHADGQLAAGRQLPRGISGQPLTTVQVTSGGCRLLPARCRA